MYSPVLSVPPRRASGWVAETDPKDARAWLVSLPLADSAESAREIYQALYTLNRIELGVQVRLELLALYDRAVATVCAGLQSPLLHATPPLGLKKRQLAEFVRRLHMEMAYGYKYCLRDLSRSRLLFRRKARSAVCIERALFHLGEILLRSYLVYLPYPDGVWRETHELYRIAESLKIATKPLGDARDGAARAAVIAECYVRTLLLGLVNPYHLPHNAVRQVHAFLVQWGPQARLTSRGGQTDIDGCFLVDIEADAPPVPLARSSQRLRRSARVLDARELLQTIRQFVLRLEQGESVETSSLGIDCLNTACIDLLRRMMRAWGESARRRYTRRQRSSNVFVCIGLNALCFFANGQRPFAVYLQSFPGLHQLDRVLETSEAAFVDLEVSAAGDDDVTGFADGAGAPVENHRVDRWRLRDIGPQGMSLARDGEAKTPLRVGDLIGVRQPADFGRWRAGVIRWLRSPEADSVEAGIEVLAAAVTPVAIRVSGEPAGDPRAIPALRLPAVDVLRRPPTLLLPRGICPVGQELELIEEAAEPRRVRVLRLLERTGSFEQVVYGDAAVHAARRS